MATIEQTTSYTLLIRGMDCAGCARTIESGVAQLAGVTTSELNFTTEKLRVTGMVSKDVVIQRIRDLGFDVVVPADPAIAEQPATATVPKPPHFLAFLWQRNETRLALLGALLIIPGLILHEILGWQAWWIDLLALGAMLSAGIPIARSAARALLINRELNINVLMTIAAIGAVIIGAYTEAGMVMVLFSIGEALEGFTAARARHAIRSMLEVAPTSAVRIVQNGALAYEERVPVTALQVGDTILVKPGEQLPMDGIVRAGVSAVNQAPITGESRLIEKETGSEVFAGSINAEGSLEIEVSRPSADNTISRMIALVEEAQERRAPVQRFVDQFARYYTPAVVVLAVLVAAVPPLFFGQPFWNPTADEFGWLYRALTLLVVACPCALVISTPVSMISAISAAARSGVLIKGGAMLEALSKVRAIAFDKTGTLTAGRPAVVALHAAACQAQPVCTSDTCVDCNDMLVLASAVERRSEHPLAQAILNETSRRGIHQYPVAESVTALVGRGVQGRVNNQQVVIASHSYFESEIPHHPTICAEATQATTQGYTPVMVGANGHFVGTITIADSVRETSRSAIARLRQAGIQAIVMLTGDQRQTAERIGADVGVTEVRAELLPAQKVAAVQELQQRYGSVAMVGDGINDTPALATANVGIAIGGAHGGTNQAMETADMTLMQDDLRLLPFTFRLSKMAMQTIRINVAFSIGVKLIFLLLTLVGLGTMWMAVLADVGTSLIVTLYGMRLLRVRPGATESA
jgi:Zn2+/Cd2+-exporting ATPase